MVFIVIVGALGLPPVGDTGASLLWLFCPSAMPVKDSEKRADDHRGLALLFQAGAVAHQGGGAEVAFG